MKKMKGKNSMNNPFECHDYLINTWDNFDMSSWIECNKEGYYELSDRVPHEFSDVLYLCLAKIDDKPKEYILKEFEMLCPVDEIDLYLYNQAPDC